MRAPPTHWKERDMGLEPIDYTCIPHKASPEVNYQFTASRRSGLAGPAATGGTRPSWHPAHKFNSGTPTPPIWPISLQFNSIIHMPL